jgi:hypothetical protein
MKRFDAPRAAALGALVVLAVNGYVLGVARWNRSGEPTSRIRLTERELAMPLGREKDDSGLFLTLALADRPPAPVARARWLTNRKPPPYRHAWLDEAKLGALGFDLERLRAEARDSSSTHDRFAIAVRAAYLALEYDGPAWRAWIESREAEVAALRASGDGGHLSEAEALLANDETSRSRLMPVDAARDAALLRARHPDRSTVVVAAGFVSARATVDESGSVAIHGEVERLAVPMISVPLDSLRALEPFAPKVSEAEAERRLRDDALASRLPAPVAPRYAATLAYGRGFEPWIEGVEAGAGTEVPSAPR